MTPTPAHRRSAAALFGLLSLVACDALTSVDTRLERASKALELGNHQAAVADARAAAEKEPNRPEVWLLQARISLKYGDGTAALKDLERAAAAGAATSTLQPLRDEALLQAGEFDKLLATDGGAEATADHRIAQARAAASLGRQDQASKLVDEVLAREPGHLEARLLKVRLLKAAGQSVAAADTLSQIVADHPKSAEVLLLKGQLALSDGDAAAAAKAFADAEPESTRQLVIPSQLTLLAALVESHLAVGDVKASAEALGRLKSKAGQWSGADLLSARVSLAQGDANTAVATLQKLIARQPDNEQARLMLGGALMDQGSVEQARGQLTKLIADRPENQEARKLLARLYASQGDLREAERVLSDLPQGVTADPTSDWMRSAVLSMSGDRVEALALLQQAAKAQPANAALQLDLARAYLMAGRREEARAVLKGIPPQKAGWAGKQLQALSQVMGRSEADARKALATLAADNPRDAELRTVIGQLMLQGNDLAGATEQFRGALAVDSKLQEARLGLAGISMRQGDLDAARAALQEVISADATSERASLGLAAINMRQGKPQDARKVLESAIAANPTVVQPRLALAELAFAEKQPQQAEALLAQALTVTRDKAGTQVRIGDILRMAGQFDKASAAYAAAYQQRPGGEIAIRLAGARKAAGEAQPEAVLRSWLQVQPGDAGARAALAEHLLQPATMKDAVQEYEKLVKATPAPALLNNLAWAYQQLGDARAEDTARRAHEGAPGNPQIADTLGWILYSKNKIDQALPLLQKASEALPDNADVQSHYKEAKARMEKK